MRGHGCEKKQPWLFLFLYPMKFEGGADDGGTG